VKVQKGGCAGGGGIQIVERRAGKAEGKEETRSGIYECCREMKPGDYHENTMAALRHLPSNAAN